MPDPAPTGPTPLPTLADPIPTRARPPLSPQRAARLRRTLTVLAITLALAATAIIAFALRDQHHAPTPSRLAQTAPLPSEVRSVVVRPSATAKPSRRTKAAPTHSARSVSASAPRPSGRTLPPLHTGRRMAASDPVTLSIPAIGVSTSVMNLGLNKDGTVQTPPLARHSVAGWYELSATPGTVGAAVVLGHIDSAEYGPGVFFRLGALNPGDEVDVRRQDGSTAVFRIDRVAEYPKTNFPTQLVYGRTSYSALRLVTCGGSFDAATRNYRDNIIAFASLR